MSRLRHIPTQALNAIFDKALSEHPLIFWMRSVDFQTQIYISEGYQTVLGHSSQGLYDHPDSFDQLILPLDKRNFRKNANMDDGHYQYHLLDKNQNPHWISDFSFPILNSEQEAVAIAGIAEDLTQLKHHGHMPLGTTTTMPDRLAEIKRNINHALQRELQLSANFSANTPKIANEFIPHNTQLVINECRVSFTKREADCLNLAMQGLSAKEIAQKLEISYRTVEDYLTQCRDKANFKSKLEMICYLWKSIEALLLKSSKNI